jgi:hypothetical protein
MSVNINLKHSSTKDKAPVPADLSSAGEIALNLHPDSPALYIKDADGDIVKLAGAGSVSTEDPDAVKKAGDTMTGPLVLSGDPTANDQASNKKYVDDVAANAVVDSDAKYVEVAGDNMTGDLTLGTDKITLDATSGLGEFAGGVNISSGDKDNPGLRWYTADGGIHCDSSSNFQIKNNLVQFNDLSNTRGVTISGDKLIVGDAGGDPRVSILVAGDVALRGSGGASENTGFGILNSATYTDIISEGTGTSSIAQFVSTPSTGAGVDIDLLTHFLASSSGTFAVTPNEIRGFSTGISGANNYNFYSSGDSPNFLRGSTYIGGNTTRNTFELWKSTLTEEQQEQLEAGTLVAPANVSLPGDGSFARQWYYDQQDAETQAELDAGTLDYPEHLLAANFIDNFALGDNSNINLLSNGLGEFGGGVKVSGGNDSSVGYGLWQSGEFLAVSAGSRAVASFKGNSEAAGIGFFPEAGKAYGSGNAFGIEIKPSCSATVGSYTGVGVDYSSDITATKEILAFRVNGNSKVFTAPEVTGYLCSNITGSADVTGFKATTDLLCADGAEAHGFESNLTIAAGKNNFNFYAAGTAPNFLAGSTYIGGTTARNTFDLWKSTLTEEQLETLEAGNLVAPANVSLPGDGEFARQWWYDQQDSETQAELDAGTVDYPTHLAAATFTDTFDLGDNTNIDLLSNGTANFGGDIAADNTKTGVQIVGAGIVTARRASNSNVWVGYETGNTNGTSYIKADGRVGLGGEPRPNSTFHLTGTHKGEGGNGLGIRTDATLTTGTGTGQITGIDSRVNTTDLNVVLNQFQAVGTQTTNVSKQTGFTADNSLISELTKEDTVVRGFESRLNTNNNRTNTYNFYAEGTAPNYFAGQIRLLGTSSSVIINHDPINGSSSDPFALDNGVELKTGTLKISNKDGTSLQLKRETDGVLAMFYQGAPNVNPQKGSISVDAAGVSFNETSDYRLKSNIVDLSAASEVVKTLQPRTYSIGGLNNVSGFIAHELQAVVPRAVTGTKDATEAIGTLADYDGTVLETAVTEPSDLTYTEEVVDEQQPTIEGEEPRMVEVTRTKTWTATGTRPVYQGVDQTKLIPLLTKALQEALERIEVLEAAAGGTTRKKK